MQERQRSAQGEMILGWILVALGAVLLLDQMDVVDARQLLLYWPVALIAIGVSQLLERL